MPVVNVKSESVFSRHKRFLGKDRTSARVSVIDAQCVLADDPRLRGSLSGLSLSDFEHLNEHLINTGDAKKQAAHIKQLKEQGAKRRRELRKQRLPEDE